MRSIKHTIQCHCVLPQYKNRPEPVFHKFIAFGIIDESDTLISKFVKCNNCGAVHKVFDICKSEICIGKEDSSAVIEIADIQMMLPEDIVSILDSYDRELPDYEHALFIMQNKKYDEKVKLSFEAMETEVVGKYLTFQSGGKAMIETFVEDFDEKI